MTPVHERFQAKFRRSVNLAEGDRWSRIRAYALRLLVAKLLYLVSKHTPFSIHWFARPFWGGKMLVVFPEPMSHAIYRYGFCETDMSAMLLEVLKPGMIFFDIGAHFGYATLLGAALVGERGQVHAFEPTPSSFQILKKNTDSAENIRINNIAVYSRKESLTFHDFGLRSSTLNSFFTPRIDSPLPDKLASTMYQVQTISLDEYARDIGVVPDVVKIDAESAESQILQGMELLFSEAKPVIIMEVGDLPGAKSESAYLVKLLTDKHYQVFRYSHGSLVQVEESTEAKYEPGNRLFVPVSRNVKGDGLSSSVVIEQEDRNK